jgi:lantibiotic modifying enzyme
VEEWKKERARQMAEELGGDIVDGSADVSVSSPECNARAATAVSDIRKREDEKRLLKVWQKQKEEAAVVAAALEQEQHQEAGRQREKQVSVNTYTQTIYIRFSKTYLFFSSWRDRNRIV